MYRESVGCVSQYQRPAYSRNTETKAALDLLRYYSTIQAYTGGSLSSLLFDTRTQSHETNTAINATVSCDPRSLGKDGCLRDYRLANHVQEKCIGS